MPVDVPSAFFRGDHRSHPVPIQWKFSVATSNESSPQVRTVGGSSMSPAMDAIVWCHKEFSDYEGSQRLEHLRLSKCSECTVKL